MICCQDMTLDYITVKLIYKITTDFASKLHCCKVCFIDIVHIIICHRGERERERERTDEYY